MNITSSDLHVLRSEKLLAICPTCTDMLLIIRECIRAKLPHGIIRFCDLKSTQQ